MCLTKILRAKLYFIALIAFIIICLANILGGYLFLPGNLQQEKTIIIKPNLSIHKISVLLEKEQIISNAKLFEAISRIYSLHEPLKSGEYKFTSSITPYQVLRKLVIGKSIIHRLFIPEGYMVNQIVDMINSENRLSGKINSNIPEGYLLPSTHFYTYQDQRNKIIDEMKKNMSKALDEVMLKLSPDSPLKTRKDILILASIIEKEAGNDLERPMISAVFINRLNKKMKLQADPTTVYAITEGKYLLNRSLKKKDLKIKSPYNTYYIKGLPKGPICCPGRASLEAAVAPAKSDALYFVVNGKGGHSFSKTLKEHNEHVQKYKARLKSKDS